MIRGGTNPVINKKVSRLILIILTLIRERPM